MDGGRVLVAPRPLYCRALVDRLPCPQVERLTLLLQEGDLVGRSVVRQAAEKPKSAVVLFVHRTGVESAGNELFLDHVSVATPGQLPVHVFHLGRIHVQLRRLAAPVRVLLSKAATTLWICSRAIWLHHKLPLLLRCHVLHAVRGVEHLEAIRHVAVLRPHRLEQRAVHHLGRAHQRFEPTKEHGERAEGHLEGALTCKFGGERWP
mmetsp:Transcript_65166/g.128908  ORF Transcript_65166/g.128908 Transcript_65166/m.128908 type:complete len:206 (-) Transcript_65166:1625-2242(-)